MLAIIGPTSTRTDPLMKVKTTPTGLKLRKIPGWSSMTRAFLTSLTPNLKKNALVKNKQQANPLHGALEVEPTASLVICCSTNAERRNLLRSSFQRLKSKMSKQRAWMFTKMKRRKSFTNLLAIGKVLKTRNQVTFTKKSLKTTPVWLLRTTFTRKSSSTSSNRSSKKLQATQTNLMPLTNSTTRALMLPKKLSLISCPGASTTEAWK